MDQKQKTPIQMLPDAIVVFVVALILRWGFLWAIVTYNPEGMLSPDSVGYNVLASNILAGHGMTMDIHSPYYFLSFFRTPVYPIFLAAMYYLVGVKHMWVGILQGFLGALTCSLICVIGQRLFGRLTGFIAGCLVALSLISVMYSSKVLTETLFTFLLVFSLWCIVEFWIRKSTSWLCFSAVFMGLAILCRPIALYYSFFLCVLLIIGVQGGGVRKGKVGLIFTGIIGILVGGWVIRNLINFNIPALSIAPSAALLYYDAEALISDMQGIDRDAATKQLDEKVQLYLGKMGQLDKDNGVKPSWAELVAAWDKIGREIIMQNPKQYIILHLWYTMKILKSGMAGVLPLLQLEESRIIENINYTASKFVGCIYVLSFVGLVTLLYRRQFILFLFFVGTIIYFVITPGATSEPRFRVPVEPLISLIAAWGCVVLMNMFNDFIKKKTSA